jgi:hypothetical protein
MPIDIEEIENPPLRSPAEHATVLHKRGLDHLMYAGVIINFIDKYHLNQKMTPEDFLRLEEVRDLLLEDGIRLIHEHCQILERLGLVPPEPPELK